MLHRTYHPIGLTYMYYDACVCIFRSYEICFVEDIGFYELATPTYDVVDWADRASRGGDGVPLKRGRNQEAVNDPPTAIAEGGCKCTCLVCRCVGVLSG
jgi:hypothetical protein